MCLCPRYFKNPTSHFRRNQKASTHIQYPHASPSSIVSLSPSFPPSISNNTLTLNIETPSCTYTDIQTTNYFKNHLGYHQEEEHLQPTWRNLCVTYAHAHAHTHASLNLLMHLECLSSLLHILARNVLDGILNSCSLPGS